MATTRLLPLYWKSSEEESFCLLRGGVALAVSRAAVAEETEGEGVVANSTMELAAFFANLKVPSRVPKATSVKSILASQKQRRSSQLDTR